MRDGRKAVVAKVIRLPNLPRFGSSKWAGKIWDEEVKYGLKRRSNNWVIYNSKLIGK